MFDPVEPIDPDVVDPNLEVIVSMNPAQVENEGRVALIVKWRLARERAYTQAEVAKAAPTLTKEQFRD